MMPKVNVPGGLPNRILQNELRAMSTWISSVLNAPFPTLDDFRARDPSGSWLPGAASMDEIIDEERITRKDVILKEILERNNIEQHSDLGVEINKLLGDHLWHEQWKKCVWPTHEQRRQLDEMGY